MSYKTISVDVSGPRKEGKGVGAISPGHLLERTSIARSVQVHSTAGGNVTPKIFAIEDDLQGNGISDAYSTGNRIQMIVAYPGDQVYARYPTGVGYTPAVNDKVVSNGDGTLRRYQAYEDSSGLGETNPSECIVGVVVEAGADGRMLIETV